MEDIDNAEPDAADLVAEPDDEPEPDLADVDIGDDEPEMFSGHAYGGPCEGLTLTSRHPKGFLWVDRQQRLVWIYDRRDGGVFTDRGSAYAIDDDRLWNAAETEEYDILVPGMESGGES